MLSLACTVAQEFDLSRHPVHLYIQVLVAVFAF